jgi:3-phosphoshikimate 1-carboxyvinyltransferase
VVDAKDAGTTFRFLTAYLSQKKGEWILTGTERMKERPIGILVDALRQLGAEITYAEKENFPPLKIKGRKLHGRELSIDGGVSSQYISALLMIAPTLEGGLKLKLTGEILSRPYIEMTLRLMHHFGIQYKWNENEIEIEQQYYIAKDFSVEADWSAASYWYELVALSDDADVLLKGLNKDSLQGDAVITEIMRQFGVQTEFITEGVRLTKNSLSVLPPQSFFYNFQSCPDLAQTLAVTCAALGVKAELSGVKNLRIKETDRLNALQSELKRIGVDSESSSFIFHLSSLSSLKTPNSPFQTYHDHRMAMCLAPLALKFGEIEIENSEVVKKSYPDFWKDLASVGFEIMTD